MIWDAIDQFVYASFLICSGYILVYKKNKLFAAVIIFGLFFLSNIFLLALLIGIPLFITILLTMFLLLNELLNNYKQAKLPTTNLYLESFLLFLGVLLLILVTISSAHLHFGKLRHFIQFFNYYGLIVGIYLAFSEINNLKIARQKSLDEEQKNLNLIQQQENQLLNNIQQELPNNLQDEPLFIEQNINNKLTTHLSLEQQQQLQQLSTNKVYTNKEIEYLRHHKNDYKKNLYFIGFLIIITCLIILLNFLNTTTLDMESLIKLQYDNNQYITNVTYYAPWENYTKNHFYTDVEAKGTKLGYTTEELQTVFPTYDEATQEKIKKCKIKVAMNQTKNLQYGDKIEFNVTYNLKNAKKNKIKIKNTHFTKKVTRLQHSITNEEYQTANYNTDNLTKQVKSLLTNDNITYSNLKLTKEKITIEEGKKYNTSYLTLTYNLDGIQDKLIGKKTISTITYKVEIYEQQNKLLCNTENYTVNYE